MRAAVRQISMIDCVETSIAFGWRFVPVVSSGLVKGPRMASSHLIPDRIPELDGLRGVAALMVVFHHIAERMPRLPPGPVLHVWLVISHTGWHGVDIFFALSGFLITRILLETRRQPHYYRNFYARRVLRLAPPYFITLILVGLLIPGSGRFLLLSLVYLANFAQMLGVPMTYGPLWSLAVEEHFYLIWPSLVRFLSRRAVFAAALIGCIATPLFRLVAQKYGFFDFWASWFRFDGLLWGATLALTATSARATRNTIWMWSTAVAALGLAGLAVGAALGQIGRDTVGGRTFVFGLVAMVTTGLIGHAALGSRFALFPLLRTRVLRFFGDISYWVYLFHGIALDQCLRRLPLRGSALRIYIPLTAVVLVSSIVTGVIVRRWIEIPALKQKKYFREHGATRAAVHS
jgi:peptidoglycan/LPS O-acetylase OafA/YrhL